MKHFLFGLVAGALAVVAINKFNFALLKPSFGS